MEVEISNNPMAEPHPFDNLLAWLRFATGLAEAENPTIHSNDLVSSISQLPSSFAPSTVDELVSILNTASEKTFSRIDINLLVCSFHVLLKTEPTITQERGLYLLLGFIEQLTSARGGLGYLARQKKRRIAENILQHLVRYFVGENQGHQAARSQRWTGQILLELIRDSEENRQLLVMEPENLRHLVSILCYTLDGSLRFVSAGIIWEMITAGIKTELFLAKDDFVDSTSLQLAVNELSPGCSNWISTVCTFIQKLTADHPVNSKSSLPFPYTVSSLEISEKLYSGTVGVTIMDDLNFIVPSEGKSENFRFISIPLHGADLDPISLDSTREGDRFALRLKLIPPWSYIFNGQQEFLKASFINIIHSDSLVPLSRAIGEAIHKNLELLMEQQPTANLPANIGKKMQLGHNIIPARSIITKKNAPSDICLAKPSTYCSSEDPMHLNRNQETLALHSSEGVALGIDNWNRQLQCARRTSSILIQLDTGDGVAKKSSEPEAISDHPSRKSPLNQTEHVLGPIPPTMVRGYTPDGDYGDLSSRKFNDITVPEDCSEVGATSQIELGVDKVQPGPDPSETTFIGFNSSYLGFPPQTAPCSGEQATQSYDFGCLTGSIPQAHEQDLIQISNSQSSHLPHAIEALETMDPFCKLSISRGGQNSIHGGGITTIPDSQDGRKHGALGAVQDVTYTDICIPEKLPGLHALELNTESTKSAPTSSSRLNRPSRKIYGANSGLAAQWDWGVVNMAEKIEPGKNKKLPHRGKPQGKSKVKKTSPRKQMRSFKENVTLENSKMTKTRGGPAKPGSHKMTPLSPPCPRRAAANQVEIEVSAFSNKEYPQTEREGLTADATCDQDMRSPIVPTHGQSHTVKISPCGNASSIASDLEFAENVLPQASIDMTLPRLVDRGTRASFNLSERDDKSAESNQVDPNTIPNGIGTGSCQADFYSVSPYSEINMFVKPLIDKCSLNECLPGILVGNISNGQSLGELFEQDDPSKQYSGDPGGPVAGRGKRIGEKLANALGKRQDPSYGTPHTGPLVSSEAHIGSSDHGYHADRTELGLAERKSRISHQISRFMSETIRNPHITEPGQERVVISPEQKRTDKAITKATYSSKSNKLLNELIGRGFDRILVQEIEDKADPPSSSNQTSKEDRHRTSSFSLVSDSPSFRTLHSNSTTLERADSNHAQSPRIPKNPRRRIAGDEIEIEDEVPINADRNKAMTPPAKRMRYFPEPGGDNSWLHLGFTAYSRKPGRESLSLRGLVIDENGSPQLQSQNIRDSRKSVGKFIASEVTKAAELPCAKMTSSAGLCTTDDSGSEIYRGSISNTRSLCDSGVFKTSNEQAKAWKLRATCSDVFNLPSTGRIRKGRRSRGASDRRLPSMQRLKNEINEQIHSRNGRGCLKGCKSRGLPTTEFGKKGSETRSKKLKEYESWSADSSVQKTLVISRSNSAASETLVEHDTGVYAWENCLRLSHQTALDMLLNTSKKLVRHLLHEEDAIKGILATYYHGGSKLLDQLEEVHDESIRTYRQQLELIKAEISGVFENALERLRVSNEMIQSLPSSKKLKSAIKKRTKLFAHLEESIQGYQMDGEAPEHEEPEADGSPRIS